MKNNISPKELLLLIDIMNNTLSEDNYQVINTTGTDIPPQLLAESLILAFIKNYLNKLSE
jgi:hypothetical protein